MRFIDRAIEEAEIVTPDMRQELLAEFPDEIITYEAVIERLLEIRTVGGIRCGIPENPDGSMADKVYGVAHRSTGSVYLNVEHDTFLDGSFRYQTGAYYGHLEDDVIAEVVGDLDEDDYQAFRDDANGYIEGPSKAAGTLVHETAHLLAPGRYNHGLSESAGPIDFITALGGLTTKAIHLNLWIPEGAWLDELREGQGADGL